MRRGQWSRREWGRTERAGAPIPRPLKSRPAREKHSALPPARRAPLSEPPSPPPKRPPPLSLAPCAAQRTFPRNRGACGKLLLSLSLAVRISANHPSENCRGEAKAPPLSLSLSISLNKTSDPLLLLIPTFRPLFQPRRHVQGEERPRAHGGRGQDLAGADQGGERRRRRGGRGRGGEGVSLRAGED